MRISLGVSMGLLFVVSLGLLVPPMVLGGALDVGGFFFENVKTCPRLPRSVGRAAMGNFSV